jgi:hypothetical protein
VGKGDTIDLVGLAYPAKETIKAEFIKPQGYLTFNSDKQFTIYMYFPN